MKHFFFEKVLHAKNRGARNAQSNTPIVFPRNEKAAFVKMREKHNKKQQQPFLTERQKHDVLAGIG